MAIAMSGLNLPRDWIYKAVVRNGVIAGFFCHKGNEIHCFRKPEFTGYWITRHDLDELTKPLFEQFGRIRTKCPESNEIGQKFVKRLGFKQSGRLPGFILYETKRLNHVH